MKQKIFVVEDHALMRKSIVAALEREPDLAVCGQAEDAPDALEAIVSLQPDLVLTDLELKNSSGIDLIKALRTQRSAADRRHHAFRHRRECAPGSRGRSFGFCAQTPRTGKAGRDCSRPAESRQPARITR